MECLVVQSFIEWQGMGGKGLFTLVFHMDF